MWKSLQIDVRNAFDHPNAQELDGLSVEEYVRKGAWTQATLDSVNVATSAVFGQRASR